MLVSFSINIYDWKQVLWNIVTGETATIQIHEKSGHAHDSAFHMGKKPAGMDGLLPESPERECPVLPPAARVQGHSAIPQGSNCVGNLWVDSADLRNGNIDEHGNLIAERADKRGIDRLALFGVRGRCAFHGLDDLGKGNDAEVRRTGADLAAMREF